jgi:hypothetical protein
MRRPKRASTRGEETRAEVNRIHAVLREGRPYELRDLQGRAISVTAAKELIRTELRVPDIVRRARRKMMVEPA